METQNNELFQGKLGFLDLLTLSFFEAGFSEKVSVHVLSAVSGWLFDCENFSCLLVRAHNLVTRTQCSVKKFLIHT